MSNPIDHATELLILMADLDGLEESRDALPSGAHIHSLFEIAIMRLEDQIMALQLRCLESTGNVHQQFDAAA